MDKNRLLTRRRFLAASAGSLGLSALPVFAKDKDDDKDPFGGFTVGVQSYCYRSFKIERAVELSPNDPRIKEIAAHVRNDAQRNGKLS